MSVTTVFNQFQTATISANNAKFPYLEKEKYEIWAMKMEYWIQNADYNLWRIVQQGNNPKRLGKDAKGNTIVHPPVSLDEHIAVTKARIRIKEDEKDLMAQATSSLLEFSMTEEEGLNMVAENETKIKDMIMKTMTRFEKMAGRKDETKQSACLPDLTEGRPKPTERFGHPAGWSKRPAPVSAGSPVSAGWLNPAARPYFRPSSVYFNNMYWHNFYDPMYMNKGRWGTAVKTSAGYSWRNKRPQFWGSIELNGDPSTDNDIGQGRHCQIWRVEDGRIELSGKTAIKTSKLDFENVYYVEEALLHFKHLIPRKCDLYTFSISELQPEQNVTCLIAKASLDESTKWHRRMAHVNFKTINKLAKECLVDGLPLKDETFYVLKEFIVLIENQLNKKVKGIRCDNGTEFKNAKLIELCGEKGIKRDYSNPRTPQQNGVAERKNRTLIEAARTMLADSKLPTMFWTEAVSTACYVLNRVSITNPHNKTPYELISGKVPQIGHLKPFGCQVTILNTSDYLGKFEGKADEGYLVGYASNSKAYRAYNLTNKRVEETMNLRFLEDKPNVQGIGHEWYFDLDYLTDSLGYTRFKTDTPAGTQETNINAGTQDLDSDSEVDEQVIVVPSFPSNSVAGPSSSNGPSVMERNADYAEEVLLSFKTRYEARTLVCTIWVHAGIDSAVRDPAGIDSAVRDPAGIDSAVRDTAGIDSAGGVSAGSPSAGSDPAGGNPADSFQPAGSFEPADESNPAVSSSVSADFIPVYADESTLPPGQSLGSSANTTRFPLPSDEEMQHSSTRKYGNLTQTRRGIDYDEVFAPVAIIDRQSRTIFGFLLLIWLSGIYQLDVKSAFLYEKLRRVRGTIDTDSVHKEKIPGIILLVQVYVDGHHIWVKPNIKPGLVTEDFEVLMKGEFEMSAMGEMNFFLGLQVKQLPDGIFISQDKYVKDMLTKFDMESVRTATTPYEAAKTRLKDETDPPVNVHLYRSMIGSLMYLTASRPDIMFAVSACSRHQVTPLTSHLNAVKKIFKYLKGQPKLGLWYPKDSPFQLEAYSDSDYAGSHGDRKSTTGGCQFLGRRLISWQCKKQTIVATSSTERPEYVAAASCCASEDHAYEIRHHFIRDANEDELDSSAEDSTMTMWADLLTIGIWMDQRFASIWWVILDGESLFRELRGGYKPKGEVVNTAASCTLFLLTGWILLVVIITAGCFISAGSYGLCCWFRVHADGHTSAGGFISADGGCVPAVCMVSAFDIAGWLVSATSHLVSAGSIQSCWWKQSDLLAELVCALNSNINSDCLICLCGFKTGFCWMTLYLLVLKIEVE
ncbi:putative ribonuclease H-like domain-containing protein [Tanacetum coccineum]